MLLALALWRGPVPVYHMHEHVLEAQGGVALAAHVRSFHAGPCSWNWDSGWHWHLVPVFDLDGDGEPDAATLDLLAQPVASRSLTSDASTAYGAGLLVDVQLRLSSTQLPASTLTSLNQTHGGPPLEDRAFRCGPDVRLLTGVSLC